MGEYQIADDAALSFLYDQGVYLFARHDYVIQLTARYDIVS